MDFTRTKIPEVIICEPKLIGDNRGYFSEIFRQDLLENFLKTKVSFCQENESKSVHGVLRGLHYQLPPFAQTKLVKVIKGSILDVVVDIRMGSPTFGKFETIELSDKNKNQLFVPRGFAHGFLVLSDEAIVTYKVDNYYNPDYDRGLAYNDPTIGINWKLNPERIQLSMKDRNNPLLAQADCFQYEMNLYE